MKRTVILAALLFVASTVTASVTGRPGDWKTDKSELATVEIQTGMGLSDKHGNGNTIIWLRVGFVTTKRLSIGLTGNYFVLEEFVFNPIWEERMATESSVHGLRYGAFSQYVLRPPKATYVFTRTSEWNISGPVVSLVTSSPLLGEPLLDSAFISTKNRV